MCRRFLAPSLLTAMASLTGTAARKLCSTCHQQKFKWEYTKTQWKKTIRRCKNCVANGSTNPRTPSLPSTTATLPVALPGRSNSAAGLPVADCVVLVPPVASTTQSMLSQVINLQQEENRYPLSGQVYDWCLSNGLESHYVHLMDEQCTSLVIIATITESDLQKWGVKDIPRRHFVSMLSELQATLRDTRDSNQQEGETKEQKVEDNIQEQSALKIKELKAEVVATKLKLKAMQGSQIGALAGLCVGDRVSWTVSDKDVPDGSVGQITRWNGNGNPYVRFPNGEYHIKLAEIVPFVVGQDIRFMYKMQTNNGHFNRPLPKLILHRGKVDKISTKGITVKVTSTEGNTGHNNTQPILVNPVKLLQLIEVAKCEFHKNEKFQLFCLNQNTKTRMLCDATILQITNNDEIELRFTEHICKNTPPLEHQKVKCTPAALQQMIEDTEAGFMVGETVRLLNGTNTYSTGTVTKPVSRRSVAVTFADKTVRTFSPPSLLKDQIEAAKHHFEIGDEVSIVLWGAEDYRKQRKRQPYRFIVTKVSAEQVILKCLDHEQELKYSPAFLRKKMNQASTGFAVGDQVKYSIRRNNTTDNIEGKVIAIVNSSTVRIKMKPPPQNRYSNRQSEGETKTPDEIKEFTRYELRSMLTGLTASREGKDHRLH